MSGKQNKKMPKKQKPRGKKLQMDARVLRIPPQPPETSVGDFPFTLQGNFASFGITSATNWLLDYPSLKDAIKDAFSLEGSIAIRVTSYSCYGPTSSVSTGTVPGLPYIIIVEDAYTGRQVRSTSTPLVRCRAGIVLPTIRQMKWYDSGNLDTVAEKHIAYFRVTDGAVCPPTNVSDSYTVVVKGFCRITRPTLACSKLAWSPSVDESE